MDFIVSPAVLIPRPETELLVEEALKWLRLHPQISNAVDVGTGSGNIAIALTKKIKTCKIVALDHSEEALKVAMQNAQAHGVGGRIRFVKSDLFRVLEDFKFDIIVANPPYIPTWEIETLSEDVKREPKLALDGGDDGLQYYRRIINEAQGYLKSGGFLIMELGYNQSRAVMRMLINTGNFTDIEVSKDFSKIDRVIKARWITL